MALLPCAISPARCGPPTRIANHHGHHATRCTVSFRHSTGGIHMGRPHGGSSGLRAVRADAPTDSADTDTLQLIASIMNTVEKQHEGMLTANAEKHIVLNTDGDMDLRSKVVASIADLGQGLLERDIEVRLLLLAALCGEHLLLLGPPGTAKSELSRRLSRLTGGRYYERLLTRFSVPEELFGPLSMKGLENDEYVRQTDGYLPTAEVAFVDEIFKANSAILNALLTLLNERLFDNGNQRFEVPLLCLVGASNELPESEELDALYDRFLIRKHVSQVTSSQLHKLAALATGRLDSTAQQALTDDVDELTMSDFRAAAPRAIAAVDLPDSVVELATGLRDYLQDKCEPPVYVSDRRFMKAINLLQVAAFADGRDQVHEYDCLLLEYVFGNRGDDGAKVRAYVLDTIASDPGLQQSELLFLGLFGRACRACADGSQHVLGALATPSTQSSTELLQEIRRELGSLVELLDLRTAGIGACLREEGFPQLRASCWSSQASAQAAAQVLAPQMQENLSRAEDLLKEALTLQVALEAEVRGGLLEKLLPRRWKQYQKGVEQRA